MTTTTREEDLAESEWLYENCAGERNPDITVEEAKEWVRRNRAFIDGLVARQNGLCGLCNQEIEDSEYICAHDAPTVIGEVTGANEFDGAMVIDTDSPTLKAMCGECDDAYSSGDVEEITYRLEVRDDGNRRTVLSGHEVKP
jgi:hypothetical protein